MPEFDLITAAAEAEAALLQDSVLVRYKPSGVRHTRLVKVVKTALDPLQPPKHKYRKIPTAGRDSPPPVVMQSPPRQPTAEDLNNWTVPPCVPGWKNPKGYAIPLDKRHPAVGWEAEINHRGMAELSEALYVAEGVCRDGVALRSKMRREREMRKNERREAELRELAWRARDEFGGKKRRRSSNGGEGTKTGKKRRSEGGGGLAASLRGKGLFDCSLDASTRGEVQFDRSSADAYCLGDGDGDEGEDEGKTTMKHIEFEREEDAIADPFGLDQFLSKLV